jgi:hypothetical protein
VGRALKRVPAAAARREQGRRDAAIPAPLVWTFDGPFMACLANLDDALRRALVQVGDVSALAILVELSLPALKARVHAGDAIQPAWGSFLERLSERYGLPITPRVRHVRDAGPLVTLVIAYRS